VETHIGAGQDKRRYFMGINLIGLLQTKTFWAALASLISRVLGQLGVAPEIIALVTPLCDFLTLIFVREAILKVQEK
jgi:hypothetical protein